MKICVISNGYPNEDNPQFGCFEKEQALALKQLGHKVSILYVDGRLLHVHKIWRKIEIICHEESGIRVYCVVTFPFSIFRFVSYSVGFWIASRFLNWGFKRLIKENGKPDVIYAHYMYNIAYASYLKKKNNIPMVGIEHWSILTNNTLPSELMRTGRLAYDNCDRLLSVSESLRLQIRKHFGNDSTVVNNMVGKEFVSSPTQERTRDGLFFFLAIGSLLPRKGFDLLLDAFNKIGIVSCRLIIVGGGPEYKNLQKQAFAMGIAERVQFVGRKNTEEIIHIMRSCHVFVLSSRAETFGVVCIEALSQGLPNVATICGGPEEILTEDDGLLIPKEDVNALAEAMKQMYFNYSKYNNKAIADNCAKRYAPQVIAAKLTKIFEETIY